MKNTSTASVPGMPVRILFMCSAFLLFTSGVRAFPCMPQEIRENITYSALTDSLDNNGQNNVREYYFDFSYLPSNTPVLDVDVRIDLTHSWTQDVHMYIVSPAGLELPFFEINGCFSVFPINTIFDDEGMASGTCDDLHVQERVQPLGFPGIPGEYLTGFDGQNASGIWTLKIEDQTPGDGGVIFEVGLDILVDIPIMAGEIISTKEQAEDLIATKVDGPVVKERNEDPLPGFNLFQNEPNPFNGETVIRFTLPESQVVSLTVFDVTGREVLIKHQEARKGKNFLVIQPDDLAATGILYYKLDASGFSATRKMIQVE